MRGGTPARLFAIVTAVTLSALARPASALPEIYAGVGASAARVPQGVDDVGFALDAGVDDLLFGLGAGLQADVGSGGTALTAQLRYSVFKIPFLRVYTGLGAGLRGMTASTSGTYGAFVGARASLGLPYLGAQLGVHYANQAFSPTGLVTLGLTF